MSGERDGATAELVMAGFGLLAAVAVSVWAGGHLAAFAAGEQFTAGFADAVTASLRLATDPGDLDAAWGRPSGGGPSSLLFWVASVVVFAAMVVVTVAGWSVIRGSGSRVGLARRCRLGVDPTGRIARWYESAPLWVPGPVPHRVVLGRVGRRLVATEDRRDRLWVPWWLRGYAGRHRNDRGAIAVFGPSRCGKTSGLAIPAILEWEGPVVALSVKSDLMGDTITRRRALGEVKVFDPADSTWEPSARWSPLRAAGTLTGAKKAAQALANATDWARSGAGDIGFWVAGAEGLLAPLLWVANRSGRGIGDVVRWVYTMDRPAGQDPGEVASLLATLAARPGTLDLHGVSPVEARDARVQLDAVWNKDFKQLSSIYVTAQAMIGVWADPTVAASSAGCDIDLDWLLDARPDGRRANTLYLCATLEEAHRLAPVLGGLLGDLFRCIYERVGKDNTPIRPTLVVIDEAGNWPLRTLPELASTVAGLGVQLLLVYQSLAQVTAVFDRRADTLISNVLTKVFFPGISDDQTQRYAAAQLGQEQVLSRQRSYDPRHGGRSVSESMVATDLLPAAQLRTLTPGDALLVHGSLRPMHLRSRPWYRDRRLRRLAGAARPEPARAAVAAGSTP